MEVRIGESDLTVEAVSLVAEGEAEVVLTEGARESIIRGRKLLEKALDEDRTIYGLNTGVGDFQGVVIPHKKILQLQKNLVRSTAAGVGDPLSEEMVRAMMLLRVNALTLGYSGVRLNLVSLLVDMLNRRVHPVIPSKGSVGSSGDLVPLAHMALVVMGEGKAVVREKTLPGREALQEAGLSPLELKAKEGLALINGTQYMAACGALGIRRIDGLLKVAQIAVAMSVEALKGTDSAFDHRLSEARSHPGQRTVSSNLRSLVRGSDIIASHQGCPTMQDPYSLRCAPQVLGAVKDAVSHCREVVEREMNSATDNPLLFQDGAVISGGNFHGEPVALALDYLGLAVSEVGSFSERRTARLVDGKLSGLPPFLTRAQGLDSGMMIPQYVAAGLTSENKLLSAPGSADSIPTSANQEDFNSMGAFSAEKLDMMLDNLEHILAIELLCAAQAVEFHQLQPGEGTVRALSFIRRGVERLTDDRSLSPDIEWIRTNLRNNKLLQWVEERTPLQ